MTTTTATTGFAPVSACGYGCLPGPDAVPRVAWPVQLLRLLALVATVLAGVCLALVMPALTAAGRVRASRGWFRSLLRASGVRLVVRGEPPLATHQPGTTPLATHQPGTTAAGTLVVANHVSWLDIPAVLAVEGVRVMAKREVRDWPVVGMLATRSGVLFIDRNRLRRLPAAVTRLTAALRAGDSVLVFPEGSTWCGRTQGRFYPATFQAAVDAGAPVRPLTLRYCLANGTPTTVAAFVGDDTLVASVWRVVTTRGLVAELVIGPTLQKPPTSVDVYGQSRRRLAATAAEAVRGGPRSAVHQVRVSRDEGSEAVLLE